MAVLHWSIWIGIYWGVLTVVLAIILTILTPEQKQKIKNWFLQAGEEE